MRAFFLVVAAASLLSLSVSAGEGPRRAAERQARAAFLKTYPEKLQKAQGAYVAALLGTAQWLVGSQARDEGAKLAQEISSLDEKNSGLQALNKSLDAIATDVPLDEAKKKELATRLKTAQKTRATGLMDLARNCFTAGLVRQSYDLIRQILEMDPDNPVARQTMGQTKQGDAWYGTWTAAQMQKGNVWLPELGWVPTAAVERTKKGEWFDNGKWSSMADADRSHSEGVSAWTIETEHFILKSAATRKASVAVAERLEGFRQAFYREYLEFFIHGSDKKGAMSFAQTETKKMTVYYYSQAGDFELMVRKEFPKQYAPVLSVYPSIYYQAKHASYHNGGADSPFTQVVMSHELARQIATEYTQALGTTPKPWVAAAMAQGIEFASAADDGKWTVPSGHQHPNVIKCTDMAKNGVMPQVSPLLSYEEAGFNKDSDRNSDVSGAFMRFLLEAKDGQYANDVLDFIYDSYKSPKSNLSLNEYTGLEHAELEKAFADYLTQ